MSSIDFDALGLDSEKFTAVFGSLDNTPVLTGGSRLFLILRLRVLSLLTVVMRIIMQVARPRLLLR